MEMTFFFIQGFLQGLFFLKEFAVVTAGKINLPPFSTRAVKVQILLGQKLVCFDLF